jgi:hypothetical protein
MKPNLKSPLLRKRATNFLVVAFTLGTAALFFSEGGQSFRSKKVEGTDTDRHGASESSSEEENAIQKPSGSRVGKTKQMRERKDELNAAVVKMDAMIEEEWARITVTHPECKRLREIVAIYDSWNVDRRRVSNDAFSTAQTWFQQSQNVIPMREYYKVILTEAYRDLARDPDWADIINKSVERQLALTEAEKQSQEFTELERARKLEIDSFCPNQVGFKRLPLDLLHMVRSSAIYKNDGMDGNKPIPDEVKSWMNDTTVAAVAFNAASVLLDDLESDKLKSLNAKRKTASYEAWNIHKALQASD